jgi:two-component system sensor histidine kinase KdpD
MAAGALRRVGRFMIRIRQFALYVAVAAGLALASTFATLALEAWLGVRSPSMTFLVGVILTAMWFGRVGALVSAVISFLVYNFYLVEPRFSFAFAISDELLTLIVYITVAIIIGGLAGNLRDARERERGRAQLFSRLFAVGRSISARADESELTKSIRDAVREIAGGEATTARRTSEGVSFDGGAPPPDAPAPSALEHALDAHDQREGVATAVGDTVEVPGANGWRVYPLAGSGAGSGGVLGALLWRPEGDAPPAADAEAAVRLIAGLAAVTLERGRLMERRIELDTLAAAEKLRTALMSSISHDFRTPLATILTSASALKRYPAQIADRDRTDMLASIEEEAERLNRFVGNILDMTRLDASALQVRADWIDPADVLEAAADRVAPRAGERRLVRRIPAAAPAIFVDPLLLEQAIVNVLENAVVHTPPSASIEIGGFAETGDVRLWVEDDGPGVPNRDVARIFDKFHRLERRRGAPQGSGLGLSISKGFVEAMGGRIEATSPSASGRGLRVDIRFPLPDSAPPRIKDAP